MYTFFFGKSKNLKSKNGKQTSDRNVVELDALLRGAAQLLQIRPDVREIGHPVRLVREEIEAKTSYLTESPGKRHAMVLRSGGQSKSSTQETVLEENDDSTLWALQLDEVQIPQQLLMKGRKHGHWLANQPTVGLQRDLVSETHAE